MRSSHLVSLVSGASLVAVLFGSSSALAADPPAKQAAPASNATTTSAKIEDPADNNPAAAKQDADKVQPDATEDNIKHIAVELNPLAIGIGRYSVQGEWVFAKHHAIVLNPFYANKKMSTTEGNVDLGTVSGFGGELGYRFYTGSKGPNGFFVGPSFLAASYKTAGGPAVSANGITVSAPEVSFTSIGAALDVGGQAVIGPGVIIGAGFGLQYTKTSEEMDLSKISLMTAGLVGGGVRPRFLLSAGYAF